MYFTLLAEPWTPLPEAVTPDALRSEWLCYAFDSRFFDKPPHLDPSFGRFRDTDTYSDIYLRIQCCAFYDLLRRSVDSICDCTYQVAGPWLLMHVRFTGEIPVLYSSITGKRKNLDLEEATGILDRYQGSATHRPPWRALADCGFTATCMHWHHLIIPGEEFDQNTRFAVLAKDAYFTNKATEQEFSPMRDGWPKMITREHLELKHPGIMRIVPHGGYHVLRRLYEFSMPFGGPSLKPFHDWVEMHGRDGYSDLYVLPRTGMKDWRAIVGLLYASKHLPFTLPPLEPFSVSWTGSLWDFIGRVGRGTFDVTRNIDAFRLAYIFGAGGILLGRNTITPHLLLLGEHGAGKSYACEAALKALHKCFVEKISSDSTLARFASCHFKDSSDYRIYYFDEPPRFLTASVFDPKNALSKQALTETEITHKAFHEKRVVTSAYQPHIICGNVTSRIDPALKDRFLHHRVVCKEADGDVDGVDVSVEALQSAHLHAFVLSLLIQCGALPSPKLPEPEGDWLPRRAARFQSIYRGIHLLSQAFRHGGDFSKYSAEININDLADTYTVMNFNDNMSELQTFLAKQPFEREGEEWEFFTSIDLIEWCKKNPSFKDLMLQAVKKQHVKWEDKRGYVRGDWIRLPRISNSPADGGVYDALAVYMGENYTPTEVPAEATNIQVVIEEVYKELGVKLGTNLARAWLEHMGWVCRQVAKPRISMAVWGKRV